MCVTCLFVILGISLYSAAFSYILRCYEKHSAAPKHMIVLGISAFYHDSAAALIANGVIIAAAQEERFSRIKHDPQFPRQAIQYCLEKHQISIGDVDHVVFYDKPLLKFDRLLETYLSSAPKGFSSFRMSMPVWMKEKLYLKTVLRKELVALGAGEQGAKQQLLFTDHHQSHAASAFYPSPFASSAVMCLDGVGEWATTSVWRGDGASLDALWQINFPHSLGMLYSAFTYYAGFKVNSGEYKLMGLAPYGEPRFYDLIKSELIDVKDDGTFHLNMDYFNFTTGLTMTNKKFDALFDGPRREAESPLTQREMDLARSIQLVTEDIVLQLAQTVHKETGLDNLCLAGGVALNCVANGRLTREGPFKNIWIQPAAGDAGGAVGAALSVWHQYLEQPRSNTSNKDSMQGSYLGPSYSENEILQYLDTTGAVYECVEPSRVATKVAGLLAQGKVAGWFQGRMEFGPRALGGRSIIGDPRNQEMQSTMNLKIKYRESFRPFAPSILAECVNDYFEHESDSPYMLQVAEVKQQHRIEMTAQEQALFGIEKLNVPRSSIPAVTHVDYSARIQTVHKETNPRYHDLLTAFHKATGCPIVVNTSFNVRGEPIVNTPEDAYRCFMRTEMDVLVLENVILFKEEQPVWKHNDDWKDEFELD